MTVEHRGESDLQRADRNWGELLGELRVVLTGVTVLFSLLLTVPFSSRFDEVSDFGRGVYLASLLLSVSSLVVLVAPVSYHRLLFRQRQKARVVTTGNAMTLVGLALLVLALSAVLLLVGELLVPRGAAVAIAGGFLLLTAGLWFLPGALRRRHRAD